MAAIGTPVFFKDKEYRSATEALQAYILDYEGKEIKYYGKKSKYDKQLMDLFCSSYDPTLTSRKFESHSIGKLVAESYDKFYRDQRDVVDTTLSASSKLMKALERDRLPSPTRSFPLGGRPSTGSVTDTEILLSAKPLIPIQVNTGENNPGINSGQDSYSQVNNETHSNNSHFKLYESAGLYDRYDGGSRNDSKGKIDINEPYMNSDLLGSSKHLSASNDILTSHQAKSPGFYVRNKVKSPLDFPEKTRNTSLFNRSLDAASLLMNHPQMMTQDKHTSNNISKGNPEQFGTTLRTPDKTKSSNSKSQSQYTSYNTSEDFLSKGHNNGYNGGKNNLNTDKTLADSDGTISTTSSIITGHMLKGAIPHRIGLSKVSSTPIKTTGANGMSYSKQLRFDPDFTKSSVGQGLEIDDLTAIRPDLGQQSAAISKYGVKFDTSFVEQAPQNEADFSYGRRDIVGILKGNSLSPAKNSPGKSRKASSRVSFTTDDLLETDPSGFLTADNLRPRSRSLPRPKFYDTQGDNDNSPHLRNFDVMKQVNDLTGASPNLSRSHRSRRTENDHHLDVAAGISNQLHSHRNQNTRNESFNSPKRSTHSSRVLNRSVDSPKRSAYHSPKESKYRMFLQSLMREVEDSASSVVTPGFMPTEADNNSFRASSSTAALSNDGNDQGGGFLERIQNLLSSEGVPTVSQYLNESDNQNHQDSITTDVILDGDRPWEKTPLFKAPTAVHESQLGKTDSIFDKFMNDCMTEAQENSGTLTGTAQPGSLEALKNMLFTVQGLSTSHDDSARLYSPVDEAALLGDNNTPNLTEPDLPLDDSISQLLSPETKKLLSTSYSKQPCLIKAMEHLSKLKDLVENKD